jgi:hypothetical protein
MFIKKVKWLQREGLLTLQGRVIENFREENAELKKMVKDLESAFAGLYAETRGRGVCKEGPRDG